MKYKVIIAGSRGCPEQSEKLLSKILNILQNIDLNELEIVSGTARGADRLGEWVAGFLGVPVKRFPADWDAHGKSAGYLRNKEMAENGTHLIALWDGVSKGTQSMIKLARDKGLKVRVIKI